MKRLLIIAFAGSVIVSCNQQAEKKVAEVNPLLTTEFNTPFNVPNFEQIKTEHYLPALKEAIKQHNAEVKAIVENKEEPTFANTFEALDFSGELLSSVRSIFGNMSGINTTEELRKIEGEFQGMLSAHGDEISLNPALFARIKKVYENKEKFNLNAEQTFLLNGMYSSLVRNGANLPAEKQEGLKKINQQLAKLAVKFEQNVLSETNSFKLVVEKKEDLAGLPKAVISAAAEAAKAESLEGKWVFTTKKPSMLPFLQYADNRELRKELYQAYINRANHDNEADNKLVLSEMVKLRVQRAQLLGYKDHSSFVLEPRMAKNPETAMNLLTKLWDKALPIAKREAKQLQAMIDKDGGKFKLESSDWWYYAEKVRKEKFNLDENEVRPYFEIGKVEAGAFAVATKLYGITFTKINDIPLPNKEATAYEVKEADGKPVGILYTDWHPRESKVGGAWCGGYREHTVKNGKEITPIVTIVGNFTRGTDGKPALISMDEVETLFHEFGHALDGLFANTSYSSSYIAWDFVELPSQIMEHWATEDEVLKMYAKHYETGEVIPTELVAKMKKAGQFNQGFGTTEYLAASLLDIAYHTVKEPKDIDIAKFEKDFFNKMGLIPEIESRYRSTYFRHIAGGYDSGYYSYIWAGVLDNDAYDAFKENGIFDTKTAESFRKNILEKNGIFDAQQMFKDFRGRDPKIEPLLKNRGLI